MRGMNIGTFPRYSTFIDNVQTFFCGFMFSRDGHTKNSFQWSTLPKDVQTDACEECRWRYFLLTHGKVVINTSLHSLPRHMSLWQKNNHLLQNRRGTDTQTRRAGGARYICCHLNPFQLEITVIKGHLMSQRYQRWRNCSPSRSDHISDVKLWCLMWRWAISCCQWSPQELGRYRITTDIYWYWILKIQK